MLDANLVRDRSWCTSGHHQSESSDVLPQKAWRAADAFSCAADTAASIVDSTVQLAALRSMRAADGQYM